MTNIINNTPFTVIIPSSRPPMAMETIEYLNSIDIKWALKDGTGYPSFAQLINHCIVASSTEITLICNDKARPRIVDFEKTISLINEGYGFVGLFYFGFFGFKKELYRKIGPLDERFVGGNYEDCDFLRRSNEANIAWYGSNEAPYLEGPSSWMKGPSTQHFFNKWQDATPDNPVCVRLLLDEKYDYDLGPETNDEFLPWSRSIIVGSEDFVNVKIKSAIE